MKTLLLVIILLMLLLIDGYGQSNLLNSQQSYEWYSISKVSGSMWEIFFIDSVNGWVAGDSGKIYATADGGATWLPQNSGTENKLRSIYFMDDQTGFASGYNQTLIRTNNGGNTWSIVEISGDSGLIYSSLGCGLDDSLYFISNFGEIHCSGDSGLSWPIDYNFNQYGFSYLNYLNIPVCYAMQFMASAFYKSTNGGKEWEKIPLNMKWSGDIYFLNESIGWVSEDWIFSSAWHDSVSIYMTLDGGETWNWQSILEGKSLTNIIFLNTFEGWLSGWGNTKIYYSPDSGKSWKCQFECDSLDWIKDIFFLNDRNGWAVTNQGKIIRYGTAVEVSVNRLSNTFVHEYVLNQNFPNPFNPSTSISYSILKPGFVTLIIYDQLGRKVQTLVNRFQRSGNYVVNFNAYNLSSGIYFYKFQVGNYFAESRKMLFLK